MLGSPRGKSRFVCANEIDITDNGDGDNNDNNILFLCSSKNKL